jgi:hypothetical protein
MATIGMPIVLARNTHPCASRRRGPRGPSGVIVRFSVSARSASSRSATDPPLKVLPRTMPNPIIPATRARMSASECRDSSMEMLEWPRRYSGSRMFSCQKT